LTTRDLYEVLGVTHGASQDEIKSAYRRLARQHHPDVNPNDPTAEEKFKEIGYAYNILSDPEKRSRYDQFGIVEDMPQDPFFAGSASVMDIFDMFFGGMQGATRGGGRRGQNGADLQTRVEISLEEVVTGAHRDITVSRMKACSECHGSGSEGGVAPETCPQCGGAGVMTRMQNTFIGTVRTSVTCPTCGGTGAVITKPCPKCKGRKQIGEKATIGVDIPAGVESGTSMQVTGEGNEGLDGGRSGDLYVGIIVKDDSRFERDRQDLHTRVDVTFAQASLGDEITIQGVGEEHKVELPSGVQPGEMLSIKGGGLPPLHGGRRGTLYAHVNVVIPKKLNEQQRELIVKLADAGGEPIPKGDKAGGVLGLFKKKGK